MYKIFLFLCLWSLSVSAANCEYNSWGECNPIIADTVTIPSLYESKPSVISEPKVFPTLTVDKSLGKLIIYYPDTKSTVETPVLTGASKEDYLNLSIYNNDMPHDSITPIGTYITHHMYSTKLEEPILSFITGFTKIAAIHPLWMENPNQKRVNRLKSPTPFDNHITNGCINIDPKFFSRYLKNIPDGVILTIIN